MVFRKTKAKKSKNNVFKHFNLILIALIITFILLVGSVFVTLGKVSNPFEKKEKPVLEKFQITDKCSLIQGQIIHPIKDESSCQQKCNVECEVRDKIYVNHSYIESSTDCFYCECSCI